jgi:heme-degrading monooxygenase HmoA
MLTRVWRGRAGKDAADSYESFLKRTAYPDYGGIPGNKGWLLLRRETGSEVEFVLISFWESEAALQRYAGPDTEKPHYYDEDRAALLEPLLPAENFETIDAQVRW